MEHRHLPEAAERLRPTSTEAGEIERHVLVTELLDRMDPWSREIFENLILGYSFEDIGRALASNPHVIARGLPSSPATSANIEAASPEAELSGAAIEYFSTAFPNPERKGCPDRERVRQAASSSTLVTGDLRTHLFQCSACFEEFRAARIAMAVPTKADALATRSRWRLSPMVAAAASVALVVGLGLIFWRNGFERAGRQERSSRGGDIRSLVSENSGTASPSSRAESASLVRIRLQRGVVRRGTVESSEPQTPPIA